MYSYRKAEQVLEIVKRTGLSLPEIAIKGECEENDIDDSEVRSRLASYWSVMERSARQGIDSPRESVGGLIGGNARKLSTYAQHNPLCGGLVAAAAAYALAVSEVSASMGRIVAAPTGGSSGILPGVLLALKEQRNLADEDIIAGLLVAACIGKIVASSATLSGAEGGCQAECGTAAAMAAGAAVHLCGGTAEQVFDAGALVIKSVLGLVCDPVAGLVEVPCSKRNAFGVSNALMSADLVLAGITSVIPFDEMVEAMARVGRQIPGVLRETAQGGCAVTPSALRITQRLQQAK